MIMTTLMVTTTTTATVTSTDHSSDCCPDHRARYCFIRSFLSVEPEVM